MEKLSDKIEQLEVARSFARTVQLKQYEPISAFAYFKAVLKSGTTQQEMVEIGYHLADLASRSVDRDIVLYKEKLINEAVPF